MGVFSEVCDEEIRELEKKIRTIRDIILDMVDYPHYYKNPQYAEVFKERIRNEFYFVFPGIFKKP